MHTLTTTAPGTSFLKFSVHWYHSGYSVALPVDGCIVIRVFVHVELVS